MNFTYKEAKSLLELFGDPDRFGPKMTISVFRLPMIDDGDSGPMLYANYTEYPKGGRFRLGANKQLQPTSKLGG